jgi:DNA-binding MarR family transcriptional regulator
LVVARRQAHDAAAAALNSGAIRLLRGLKGVDRRSGLTPARLSALSVVVFGGPMSVGRLAESEDIASPTMTRIVDGLEALGLVQRTRHPLNGRISLVEATPRGERLMRTAAARRRDAIAHAIDQLDESDRRAVLRAAEAIPRLAALLPRD